MARHEHNPLHGLDAYQRLEDRQMDRPPASRGCDLVAQRCSGGGDGRLVQPNQRQRLVLHAAPGRRRVCARVRRVCKGRSEAFTEGVYRVFQRSMELDVRADPLVWRPRTGTEIARKTLGGRLAILFQTFRADVRNLGEGFWRPGSPDPGDRLPMRTIYFRSQAVV